MAIDMNAESSTSLTSPRISFSFDLHHPENNPNPESCDSSFSFIDDDFDFCINSNCIASSTADDLFLDGKIRSLQLQDKSVIFKHESLPIFDSQDPILPIGISNPDCLNEIQPGNLDPEKGNNQSKAFKRSSSLHCDNTNKKNSFWFTLPLLSRSNSTGSVTKAIKENHNHNPKSKNLKNSVDLIQSSSLSSSSHRKPPLKKHNVSYKSNNTKINYVLNGPPPRITGNLLGFGAIFGSGDKMKKIKK